MSAASLGILALTLCGCASHTGVVAIDQDTYMVAKQKGTGFPGIGNMKAEIISEGVQYCSSRQKNFQLVSSQETQPPYILGNYPRAEISFMCLGKGDAELQRAKLQPMPDTVIEIRPK